jgi:hypothetical protein
MSVGVKVLDGGHKKLVDLVNEQRDAILQGRRQEALGHVLEELALQPHYGERQEIWSAPERQGRPLACCPIPLKQILAVCQL